MSSRTRFIDDGQRLSAFADEVLVKCARCGEPGCVVATWTDYRWSAAFNCTSCELSLSTKVDDWVGPVETVGRRPCGQCGHKWLMHRVMTTGFPRPVLDYVMVQCSECGHSSRIELTQQRAMPDDHAIDPHFGLPLYLTYATRLGLVWAYNPKHLEVLRAYVEAKLRIRQGGGNKAMFSRLPTWMKLAKNRQSVLKAFAKLETMLSKAPIQMVRTPGTLCGDLPGECP